ncbi:hypothetical protein LEP1GSC120_1468 [Leptospira santarosai str. 200702252]|nr:hypothetical protein LEP1GSC163_2993 [Leptospira santarosai str. CBC379]EKS09244.1 hypothetical protein LEP1GSC071_2750 [Leptospira santarosai str. JET]EMO72262.1 hypothetical protein LEP1GSC130_0185 [Leptospira santarosai str. 200403458]EMO99180.1 hypothetical protein LEP1GSC120_1468 [Leptospira santarosai str. 200702252]EPG81878.1 hypothetical protein LEP1GSC048_2630 [Leptospira santarosai serovar Shermani str. 1342KT]
MICTSEKPGTILNFAESFLSERSFLDKSTLEICHEIEWQLVSSFIFPSFSF